MSINGAVQVQTVRSLGAMQQQSGGAGECSAAGRTQQTHRPSVSVAQKCASLSVSAARSGGGDT